MWRMPKKKVRSKKIEHIIQTANRAKLNSKMLVFTVPRTGLLDTYYLESLYTSYPMFKSFMRELRKSYGTTPKEDGFMGRGAHLFHPILTNGHHLFPIVNRVHKKEGSSPFSRFKVKWDTSDNRKVWTAQGLMDLASFCSFDNIEVYDETYRYISMDEITAVLDKVKKKNGPKNNKKPGGNPQGNYKDSQARRISDLMAKLEG